MLYKVAFEINSGYFCKRALLSRIKESLLFHSLKIELKKKQCQKIAQSDDDKRYFLDKEQVSELKHYLPPIVDWR